MRKHIYLNMSVEDTREMLDDPLFVPVPEYDSTLREKQHQYEYGMIKTDFNFYHILAGHIPVKNCHWCGGACITKIVDLNEIDPIPPKQIYCFKICTRCEAQGPKLKISSHMLSNKKTMDEVEYILEKRFLSRIEWFDQLDLGEKNEKILRRQQ